MKAFKAMAAAAVLVALAACGEPSRSDIMQKGADAATEAELEAALGKPTEISKIGPIQKWIYKASDGNVVFVITGGTVAMQMGSE